MKQFTEGQKEEINKEVKKEVEKRFSKQLLLRAKRPLATFHLEFKQQTAAAIIAAFGFLIALVWKDIIVQAMDALVSTKIFPEYEVFSKILSALLITTIAVIALIFVNRWAKKPEQKSQNPQ